MNVKQEKTVSEEYYLMGGKYIILDIQRKVLIIRL